MNTQTIESNASTGTYGKQGSSYPTGTRSDRTQNELSDPAAERAGKNDSTAKPTEFSAFLDDLLGLLRNTVGEGSDLRGQIEQRVTQAREQLSQALEQAQKTGSEVGAKAREGVQRGVDVSREMVTERPLSSVSIAAVGGLIVGMLLTARR